MGLTQKTGKLPVERWRDHRDVEPGASAHRADHEVVGW